jgi:hypothetical protein
LLFGTFYVAALAVAEDEFYPALVGMHVVDAGWFLFGFSTLLILRPVDRPGEIKIASNRQIMVIFFWLSVVTIGMGVLLFSMTRYGKIEIVTAKAWFLGSLGVLSLFDFIKLKEYYFRHSDWITQNTA